MSTATAPATTAAPASAAAGAFDVVASRVQKSIDALNAKIAKLQADNAALKSQLAAAKSSNSRIRRIPKKAADAPAAQ